MSKPLIFIPSPRDIKLFNMATAHIEAPKFWVKYHPEEEAYKIARDFFLERTKASHLVILPDDLLITPNDFEFLKHDANHYGVISGWCRNTIRLLPGWKGEPETEENADTNVSTTSLPPDPPSKGTYEGFHFDSMSHFNSLIASSLDPILEVKFAGFPLTFISRQVVEQVPFRRDGCCVDSCFALDIAKKGIRQFVDLRVRTTHMNRHPDEIQVGKKEGAFIFEDSAGD